MKKYKILLLVIFFIAIFAAFSYLKFQKNSNLGQNLPTLECSLNLQNCSVLHNEKYVEFKINPRPFTFMEETDLYISNLSDKYKKLRVEIFGVNMNMGTIKANLTQISPQKYHTKIVLSSCILSTMRYRIKVYDGDEDIGLSIDFDLAR